MRTESAKATGAVRRLSGWRPGRRAAVVALLLAAITGGTVGAALNATSTSQDQAQALLVISPSGSQAEREARTSLAFEAFGSPYIGAATADLLGAFASPEQLADDVSVSGNRSSGLLAVTARGDSPDFAARLANAFANETADFLEATRPGAENARAVGNFEVDLDWKSASSAFSSQASELQFGSPGKYGRNALGVVCPLLRRCGTWTNVFQQFTSGRNYVATGWARLTPGVSETVNAGMFMGMGRVDGTVGRTHTLTERWKPFLVSWSPRRSTSSAQIGFLIRPDLEAIATGDVRFQIDGVAVQEVNQGGGARGEPLPAAVEKRLFERNPSIARFPARPIGPVSAASTLRWALGGAAIGLLTALAGVGFGRAAIRRRDRRG